MTFTDTDITAIEDGNFHHIVITSKLTFLSNQSMLFNWVYGNASLGFLTWNSFWTK